MSGWKRTLLVVLGTAAACYGVVAADLVLRARSAYLEGEKYMRWHAHPEEKAAFYAAEFEAKKAELAKQREKGELSKEEHDERLELAAFERDHRVSESSLKYAYVWFQTAVELFTPPESRWIVRSRERMAEAKRLWQDELRAKGIPFEEYVFE